MDNLKKNATVRKNNYTTHYKKKNFLCKFGTKVSHYAKIKLKFPFIWGSNYH